MAKNRSTAPKPVPKPHQSDPPFRRHHLRGLQLAAALTLLTLVVFGQVGSYDFVDWDDNIFITENPVVQAGITLPGIRYALITVDQGSWHPVTWLSHMLVCQFFGLDPWGHHIANLLLHIACAILLLFWLAELTGAVWRSALVACVLALHPLHVEVVAWVSERKDLLAMLFALLALLAWTRWVRLRSLKWYGISLAMFALGLMSKPTIVTMPFLLLLLDYWPHARLASLADLRPRLVEKLPFFVLTAAISVATWYGQGQLGALHLNVPFTTRLMNLPANYLFYLHRTFWPVNLAPHYPYTGGYNLAASLAGMVVIAMVTAVVLWKGREHRYLVTGWFWFLGILVPMSGLIIAGETIHADRFSYGAHIGLGMMVIWGLHDLVGARWNGDGVKLAAGVMVAAMAGLSWNQAAFWRDTVTLFRHAIEVTEPNSVANYVVAVRLSRENRQDEALGYARESLRINPNFLLAQVALASIQVLRNALPEALAALDRVLQLDPNNAASVFQRGRVLGRLGREAESRETLQAALKMELEPALRTSAWFELGRSFMREKQEEKAIPLFEKALELDPLNELARKNLGFALMNRQRYVEAYGHFRMLSGNQNDQDVQQSLRFLGTIVK